MSLNVNKTDKKQAPLLQLLAGGQNWFREGLMLAFSDGEAPHLRPADLTLLAQLDCDTTHASELARRMGVSRQSVTKLLQNLVSEGLVELRPVASRGNKKCIIITGRGKAFIDRTLGQLERLEATLEERIGHKRVEQLRDALSRDWGPEG